MTSGNSEHVSQILVIDGGGTLQHQMIPMDFAKQHPGQHYLCNLQQNLLVIQHLLQGCQETQHDLKHVQNICTTL